MAASSSSSSARRPRAGDNAVGQFLVGEVIGKGSFAQVYLGRHKVRRSGLFSRRLPIPSALSRLAPPL